MDIEIKNQIDRLYINVGEKITQGNFKNALEEIFEFVRFSNKYFDEKQPWVLLKEKPEECGEVLYNCLQIITNLSNLLAPFIPFSVDKIRTFLRLSEAKWCYEEKDATMELGELEVLFERIDKKVADEELSRMGNAS